MSSELFESREDDLRQICENVRKKLTDQLPRCVGGGCGRTIGFRTFRTLTLSYIDLLGSPVLFHLKALSPYSCYEVTF